MNVLLSSIAKNDIRLLMRVFNTEKENKGIDFLEELQVSINNILTTSTIKSSEIAVNKMENFPVIIHYVFENEENLFITAIFKELN
ncbi:hypothetical protein [Chryseobacterium oranimense]|jgi:hypothetical protein|uniref:ParE toxin of type II toxin-antitoxin system, parDE n=2 Tax=Chryseobacterium oranimense TaxID=421058 RepID=A0A1M5VCR6_9FLAO|nr:hypothetical protein [Chryseobacterium oranimense]CEJ71212.1 hypothetical protein BN1195_03556 [Chryseobacterium oranimense G311]SHH73059.1 hypothetical protein SAMN05421866_3552 [Chryseobacterium oranimense]